MLVVLLLGTVLYSCCALVQLGQHSPSSISCRAAVPLVNSCYRVLECPIWNLGFQLLLHTVARSVLCILAAVTQVTHVFASARCAFCVSNILSTSTRLLNAYTSAQIGFAMLEAGSVRYKSTKNILLKNVLNTTLTALVWWALGHTFATGRTAVAATSTAS